MPNPRNFPVSLFFLFPQLESVLSCLEPDQRKLNELTHFWPRACLA